MARLVVCLLLALASVGIAFADEHPIGGTVKAVDVAAKTLTVESPAKPQPRVVVIEIRAESKIVRSRRSTDPARPGFVEEAVVLNEIKPGFTVSVRTKHDGDRAVAVVVGVLQRGSG